jgi:hypothetical protein
MDRLTSGLDPETREKYPPAIIAALKLAHKKLDRYYSLTDSTVVYRIAMVLHPGMKLEYFKRAEWEADWIEQAESLVRDEYMSSYQAKSNATQAAPVVTGDPSNNNFADFGNLSVTTAPRSNELDDYLRLTVENVADPLVWWHNNRFVYPMLHRMALDYLSAPATSTAVERVFSQGRNLLPYTRNRLSASSIRAYLCLGSWCRNDLVTMHDIAVILKENSKKRKHIEVEDDRAEAVGKAPEENVIE